MVFITKHLYFEIKKIFSHHPQSFTQLFSLISSVLIVVVTQIDKRPFNLLDYFLKTLALK